MFKDYITILVGTLQRIHRQYVRYESALDNTLIGIENLNSGYLTHHILDPKILAKHLEAVEDGLEKTAPEFEPVLINVYQYYDNSLISFTNTIDDLLLQLPILIKLKVQVPMSLFSIETAPVPLDAEAGNYLQSYTNINCGNAPEARDGYFTTYYSFNKIVLDIITEKFNIQVDENTKLKPLYITMIFQCMTCPL